MCVCIIIGMYVCLWMLAPCFPLGLFMLVYVLWCEYTCGCDLCGCVHALYVEMKCIMVHAMMLYDEMR